MGKIKQVPLSALRNMGHRCGGRGCQEHCGPEIPEGWIVLVAHSANHCVVNLAELLPQEWVHDKVLCPKHAARVDKLLVPRSV